MFCVFSQLNVRDSTYLHRQTNGGRCYHTNTHTRRKLRNLCKFTAKWLFIDRMDRCVYLFCAISRVHRNTQVFLWLIFLEIESTEPFICASTPKSNFVCNTFNRPEHARVLCSHTSIPTVPTDYIPFRLSPLGFECVKIAFTSTSFRMCALECTHQYRNFLHKMQAIKCDERAGQRRWAFKFKIKETTHVQWGPLEWTITWNILL